METLLRIKSISVLSSVQVTLKHRIRDPTLTILQSIVSRKSASPGVRFLGLEVLVGLSEGWIDLSSRISEEVVGGRLELAGIPGGVGSLDGSFSVLAR